MCDAVRSNIRSGHRNSTEEFENIKIEDTMPVYEEITTMKTEVIEEYYDYGTLDDMEPYTISPYEQTLKNDCYEQHITSRKEENDVRLSGHVATKDDKKYVLDKYSYSSKNKPKGEKRFKCESCGKPFRRKTDLMKHVKTHDDERQKEFRCPFCKNAYYTNYNRQSHIDVKHAHKKYKCGSCDYTTSYKYVLKKHELIKHRDAEYKCKYCEHYSNSRTNLENHERTHSSVKLLKCTYKNCVCEQQHGSNKEQSCHCDPCQFETAYGSNLRDHILVKHSVKIERHTCTICTYSTHFKRYLRKHLDTHANKDSPNKYKCEYCNHTTRWKGNLKEHALIHTNQKVFKCTYMNCKCDRVGEKPCDCKACGYQTVHKGVLKTHILIKHSGGPKKYNCTFCDYASHLKQTLKRHLLRIHANAKSVLSENS